MREGLRNSFEGSRDSPSQAAGKFFLDDGGRSQPRKGDLREVEANSLLITRELKFVISNNIETPRYSERKGFEEQGVYPECRSKNMGKYYGK